MGTMSFIRKKTRRGKDGVVHDYYYLVENRWEKGEVHQKVIKYLGVSPHKMEIPIEPELAGQLAQILMSGKQTSSELKETLKKLGVPVGAGKIKEVSLIFKPPLKKLTLCIL